MPPESGIQWNRVTWYSKTLAVLLFVILVCGAFFFGTWYQEQKVPVTSIVSPLPQTTATYKQGYYGEIPSAWNTYSGIQTPANSLQDLTSPTTLAYSFSPHGINFGDGAFDQVDFYYLTKAAATALVDQANQEKDKVTTETVGGLTSTVIHYPTDNGQIDKNGSGGADYIIPQGTVFLLMRDWSLGNQEFENGFQHFLQTAQFQTEG